MSRPAPATAPERTGAAFEVADARQADVPAVVAAVSALLGELRGTEPAQLPGGHAACERLVDGRQPGSVLVARVDGGIVGVLTATWQTTIHTGGEMGIVHELYTEPAWRAHGVGAALVRELAARAAARGVRAIEVGLPRASFGGLARTEAFYRAVGFEPVGPRMRLTLGERT